MTRMWEAWAAPGRLDELLAHLLATAPPEATVYRGTAGAERVVVVDPTGAGPADIPAELVDGPPHAWDFDPVPR